MGGGDAAIQRRTSLRQYTQIGSITAHCLFLEVGNILLLVHNKVVGKLAIEGGLTQTLKLGILGVGFTRHIIGNSHLVAHRNCHRLAPRFGSFANERQSELPNSDAVAPFQGRCTEPTSELSPLIAMVRNSDMSPRASVAYPQALAGRIFANPNCMITSGESPWIKRPRRSLFLPCLPSRRSAKLR